LAGKLVRVTQLRPIIGRPLIDLFQSRKRLIVVA
jgi:hypothetical protein